MKKTVQGKRKNVDKSSECKANHHEDSEQKKKGEYF